MYMYIYEFLHIYTHTHAYIYLYVYVYIYMYIHICMYTDIHTHTAITFASEMASARNLVFVYQAEFLCELMSVKPFFSNNKSNHQSMCELILNSTQYIIRYVQLTLVLLTVCCSVLQYVAVCCSMV